MSLNSSRKIYPKKSLGQNYLIDKNVCRNIVNSFEIQSDDYVIEIGSGQGAMTKDIIEKTSNFIGIELDKNNYQILKGKFTASNFINEDFLKYKLSVLPNAQLRVIG
ncbi:MAG: rRNA adenine N-6-methyltransferase family protein, partial [Saprospiraceae bacterium]